MQHTLQGAKPASASYLQEWLNKNNTVLKREDWIKAALWNTCQLRSQVSKEITLNELVWVGSVIAGAISKRDAHQAYNAVESKVDRVVTYL